MIVVILVREKYTKLSARLQLKITDFLLIKIFFYDDLSAKIKSKSYDGKSFRSKLTSAAFFVESIITALFISLLLIIEF